MRFVTKEIHAYLDYPVAIALMVLPFLLGLGDSAPLALWLSVVTGAAAFALTILTDHHLGLIQVLPYSLHLLVDGMVGVTFLIRAHRFGLPRHRRDLLLGQRFGCCDCGRSTQVGQLGPSRLSTNPFSPWTGAPPAPVLLFSSDLPPQYCRSFEHTG